MPPKRRPQMPPAKQGVTCRKVECEKAAFLSDWHIPLQDEKAVELALKFLGWFRPNTIFVLGDFLDCRSVAKFTKNPEIMLCLWDDLCDGQRVLKRLRKVCPKATIKVLAGNHEYRITKYLWDHAKELSKLPSLQLPALLKLDEIGAEYFDYHHPQKWHGLHVEHGDRASKHSGFTAKAMLETRGVSGISGHTHRLGAHFRTDESGVKAWWENGCLLGLNPDYIIASPNWQHGFSLGFAPSGKRRFVIEQVPILESVLFYQGREWRV